MKYDAILLDDDSLVHMTWKKSAKNKEKSYAFKQKKNYFPSSMRLIPIVYFILMKIYLLLHDIVLNSIHSSRLEWALLPLGTYI